MTHLKDGRKERRKATCQGVLHCKGASSSILHQPKQVVVDAAKESNSTINILLNKLLVFRYVALLEDTPKLYGEFWTLSQIWNHLIQIVFMNHN